MGLVWQVEIVTEFSAAGEQAFVLLSPDWLSDGIVHNGYYTCPWREDSQCVTLYSIAKAVKACKSINNSNSRTTDPFSNLQYSRVFDFPWVVEQIVREMMRYASSKERGRYEDNNTT